MHAADGIARRSRPATASVCRRADGGCVAATFERRDDP